MNAHSHSTISSAARVTASALLAVSGLATSAAGALAGQGGSGSIWTTSAVCDAPAPQNANHYSVGDELYLRGANFAANATVAYAIVGLPGGASGDPTATVASGTGLTGSDGSFCVDAYKIAGDDWGEYKATVTQGKTNKSDNYNVEAASEATGDTAGDESGDTAGDTAGDESGDTAGDESGDESGDTAGDGTGDTAGDTGNTGDTAGDESGDTAGDTAGDSTGDNTDDTAADAGNTGDTTGPTQDVLGTTDGTSDTTGPTQDVLGTTDRGSNIELPATDTLTGAAPSSSYLMLAGLGLMVCAGILFAPTRRRTSDDVA